MHVSTYVCTQSCTAIARLPPKHLTQNLSLQLTTGQRDRPRGNERCVRAYVLHVHARTYLCVYVRAYVCRYICTVYVCTYVCMKSKTTKENTNTSQRHCRDKPRTTLLFVYVCMCVRKLRKSRQTDTLSIGCEGVQEVFFSYGLCTYVNKYGTN